MNITGKLNASTEIIPIQGPSESKKHEYSFKTNFKPKKHFKKYPYFVDPMIVPRVKQYLEDHKNSVYVDIDDIVNELQKKYRDYSKRKRSAFKAIVEKAFAVVLQSCGLVSSIPEQYSDSTEDELYSDEPSLEGNITADQLLSMYMTKQTTRGNSRASDEDKELINISSDEDDTTKKTDEKSKSTSVKQPQPPPTTTHSTVNPACPISNLLKSKAVSVTASSQGKPGAPTRVITLTSAPTPAPASTIIPVSSSSTAKLRKRKAESDELDQASGAAKKKREVELHDSKVTFRDVGGISKVLKDICKLLIHIRHPEVYDQLGISPPRGFLLHGPPGCGKTLLAHAIAGELEVPLVKVAAPELVAGVSGESEERIRDLFDQAASVAPCILFLDEVDAITPHRHTAQREMERRIVAQLLSCLDELGQKKGGKDVLVIGATNRPDALDPALRRAGRFDREVCLGIPDEEARSQILMVLCSELKLAADFDYGLIARNTPGFVGADLMSLTREAAMVAVDRILADVKRESLVAEKEACKMEINKSDEVSVDISDDKREESSEAQETICTDKESKDNSDSDANNGKQKTEGEESPKEVRTCESVDEVQIDDETTNLDIPEMCGNADSSSVFENIIKEKKKRTEDKYEAVNLDLEDMLSWLHKQLPLTRDQLGALHIEVKDFMRALKHVQPSAKREGFATVPDVTWDDVGSLKSIREELQMAILAPVSYPEKFAALGISSPTGVLLCGPPGCGKTLLAKAVANEAGINFISVKGPELLNMYVGESEKAVRQCFQRARNSSPCVIFFDELDALCPKRSDNGEGGATMRVVNQLLTEMDGIEGRKGVFVMAATNRPDIIDPAILRPGRLDKILYVGLPGPEDRVDILRALTKGGTKPCLADDVNLEEVGKCQQCQGYSGADLAALIKEAGIEALKEYMSSQENALTPVVAKKHFRNAFMKIRPSVPMKDQKHYEKLRRIYSVVPSLSYVSMEEGGENKSSPKEDKMDVDVTDVDYLNKGILPESSTDAVKQNIEAMLEDENTYIMQEQKSKDT